MRPNVAILSVLLVALSAATSVRAQMPLPTAPAPKALPAGPTTLQPSQPPILLPTPQPLTPQTPPPQPLTPQTPPPQPFPPLYPGSPRFSPAEFEKRLKDLKAQREALDAQWKATTRRLNTPDPVMEPEPDPSRSSAKRIIDELKRQQRERANLTSTPVQPKQDPIPEPKKELEHETKANPIEPPLGAIPVDPVYLAQTLFRGQRYEEALTEFRKIDLKGKKQEERAPIIYLTAECLQRLGKTDEAIAMLRDIANSKGDEHMAEYAQWQIENLRWQRATQNSLQAIRSRLEELEKR